MAQSRASRSNSRKSCSWLPDDIFGTHRLDRANESAALHRDSLVHQGPANELQGSEVALNATVPA